MFWTRDLSDEEVFPDPNDWRPTRWLEAREEARAQMRHMFWAYGSEDRVCIAKHLANDSQSTHFISHSLSFTPFLL